MPDRCGVPGDLRGGRARSRDDRPVPGRFPATGRGPVHAGAGAVRPAGHGAAGDGRAGRHEDRRERVEGGEPDGGAAAEARRGAAAAHAAADAAEDELFGEGGRGDEVPAELAGPRTRAERIAAALAELEAERQAAEAAAGAQAQAYLARGRPGGPARRRRRRPRSPRRRARLERARAARAAQIAALEATGGRAARWRAAAGTGPAPGREDYCQVKAAREALEKAEARRPRQQPQARRRAGPGRRSATSPTRTRG